MPNCFAAKAERVLQVSVSDRSPVKIAASAPSAETSVFNVSSASRLWFPARIRRSFSVAKRSAAARPMPREAPVIMIVLFMRSSPFGCKYSVKKGGCKAPGNRLRKGCEKPVIFGQLLRICYKNGGVKRLFILTKKLEIDILMER